MRIAVNTRLLISGKLDGIGWFSHEVLRRLARDCPEHEFLFIFDRAFDNEFLYEENVWAKVLFPQARHPLLYRMYFEYSVPKALKQWRADLFFSPDGFLSTRTTIPQIPVIHDINFEHRPEDLPKSYANYYRDYFPRFAKKAKRILTVSEYSANDIAETYKIDRGLIHVAHNGYNESYRPLAPEDISKSRDLYAKGKPYFIFVGNFSFRKNVHGIVSAYDKYRSSGGEHKLLLVGNPLWRYAEMDEALSQSPFAEDIVFKGHLSIDELTKAMGGATALLFPSYFEGFGIPIIESFAAGIPVICSNLTALPEVAGEAALYCSPDDHDQMAAHMRSIEMESSLRENLIEAGKNQLQKFSWDQTANKVKQTLFHV
jgi:glycosyltransferase involved in cell wall biosynthesis